MALPRLFLIPLILLLTACATENQVANDTPQVQATQNKEPATPDKGKLIKEKYEKAVDAWLEKLTPITEDLAKTCNQKNDDAYIKCINKKNDALIESCFFPDLVSKMLTARKEFDQKLINKQITREQFMENVTSLQNNLSYDINARIANDLKSGVYSGIY